MFVTIIAHHLCTVNRNAIVLLTLHQKYYGEKLLYAYRTYAAVFVCIYHFAADVFFCQKWEIRSNFWVDFENSSC